ncbi:MAG: anthranilate phosphoribosyltransferase [Gammaproteobacteria bacterium]
MDMQTALQAISERHDLSPDEMAEIMRLIMGGHATAAQVGAFLIGLRMKGETVDELTAAARVMRELATPVHVSPDYLVDTCGTGGDAQATFNISTTSAFVAAGAGARVAKHGNRSVSSRSGSADVLEAAGVNLNLDPEQVARCIEETGVGFLYAPLHHGAMKHAAAPRRELGIRTVFNLLGPLTNPAAAPNQVLGVFAPHWLEPMAEVLKRLGSRHVLVVHAADGLDEFSTETSTRVAESRGNTTEIYTVTPEQLGLARSPIAALRVHGVNESLQTMRDVLDDVAGPARDIVALNAGAAIYAAGVGKSLKEGVALALKSIATGAARERLAALVRYSQSL